MGGFEIRPVTGAEMSELAAGRCTCGCEDTPQEGLAPVAREFPRGAPAWVAGLDLDFAANVDGRWAPSWTAFEIQMRRQHEAELELLRFAGIPPDRVPPRVDFTVGVAVAKDWTLGQRDEAPFIRYSPMPVTNGTVAMVIAAGAEMAAGSAQTSWFVEGALAWLRWITGQLPEVVYPPAA